MVHTKSVADVKNQITLFLTLTLLALASCSSRSANEQAAAACEVDATAICKAQDTYAPPAFLEAQKGFHLSKQTDAFGYRRDQNFVPGPGRFWFEADYQVPGGSTVRFACHRADSVSEIVSGSLAPGQRLTARDFAYLRGQGLCKGVPPASADGASLRPSAGHD